MVTFELRQPIETREPRIEVDPGLPPGTYRFALTVTDEAGNESRQDVQTVRIQQSGGGRNPIGPVIRGPVIRGPDARGATARGPTARGPTARMPDPGARGPTGPNPNRRSSIRRRR